MNHPIHSHRIRRGAAVLAILLINALLLLTGCGIAETATYESLSDWNSYETDFEEFSSSTQDFGEISGTENNGGTIVNDTEPLTFRNDRLLQSHYEKHGIDMGFDSPEEYEAAASAVVSNPAALHKIESEDGDDVYYVEATNEFVVVSTDGFLRTYFNPDRGIDYFNKQ